MGTKLKFEDFDIDKMFAGAVKASENTGEKDPSSYGKSAKRTEPTSETKNNNAKIEDNDAKTEVVVKEQEVKEAKTNTPQAESHEEKPETKKPEKVEVKESLSSKTSKLTSKPLVSMERVDLGSVDVDLIGRIIKMKEILDGYNEKEQEFIKGYFQEETGDVSKIIHSALTTNPRNLEAVNEIVIARSHSSAERAFYLMELDNNNIEAIYEQIELFTGELEEIEKVTEINKIKVCRSIENVIANLDNSVFVYISKLQEFAVSAMK